MTQRDILIIGGGLVGTTLSLVLAQAGHSVTLIDQLSEKMRKEAAFDGRSYAVAQASCRLLQAAQLWPALGDVAQPIHEIKVSDGRAGEGPAPHFLHFDQAELEDGPMGHMIEDRHLRAALLKAVADTPQITHLAGEIVTGQLVTRSGVEVTLASGKSREGRVLIGADGRRSGTAQRAGIRHIRWRYGQTALVAALEHDAPHNGIAHQFFMPAGPLAILPLTGNRSSIVWSETEQDAARIHALPDASYLDHLRPRFGSFLGDIRLAGRRYSYPLSLDLAQSFVAQRVALIGDAAHGVHPIAGQGLNASLRDVAALAEVLTDANRRGEDIGASPVLDRYQTWRRFDATALALATDGFNRLFSNENPILRAARQLGVAAVQGIPELRRGFMREAAGLTGEVPKLMRGAAL